MIAALILSLIPKRFVRWLYFASKAGEPLMGGVCEIRRTIRLWSAAELRDYIAAVYQEKLESSERDRWLWKYVAQRHQAERLTKALQLKFGTVNAANRALHIADLEQKVKTLKQEVTELRQVLEHRNRQRAAEKYIVRCTGCEAGRPPGSLETLSEKEVQDVEQIAKRLRISWNSHVHRKEREACSQ